MAARWLASGAALAALVWAPPALAYPTCIIFAPTGTTGDFGVGNLAFFEAVYGNQTSVWSGFNVGVIPGFPYGGTGLSFGGIELGLDVISEPSAAVPVKPLANVKLGLLVEKDWLPDVSIGIMSLAYLTRSNSLNYAYLSGTKTLGSEARPLGRFTAGLGNVMPTDPGLFAPSPPLSGTQSLLLGYEFPPLGPFSIAIDHVGGISEVSNTNACVNLEVVPGTFASVGYSIGHDRTGSSTPDAFFVQTYTNFDLKRAFARPEATAR